MFATPRRAESHVTASDSSPLFLDFKWVGCLFFCHTREVGGGSDKKEAQRKKKWERENVRVCVCVTFMQTYKRQKGGIRYLGI